MSESSGSRTFGDRRFGDRFGGTSTDSGADSGQFSPFGSQLADALGQIRSLFEPRGAARVGRGDVRAAVLALLAEQAMHGYQIIAEIEQRSGGAWKPSAGSVYPTLQLLADEGLVLAEVSSGRKTYSLTDSGRAAAKAAAGNAAPWEDAGNSVLHGPGPLPKAALNLAQAAAQVQRTGTPAQREQAATVLSDARRALYSILAQD